MDAGITANAAITQLVKEARAKIAEAERIADTHGISFEWNLEYGMGGHYQPAGTRRKERIASEVFRLKKRNPDATPEDLQRWAESIVEQAGVSDEGGWRSSSADC